MSLRRVTVGSVLAVLVALVPAPSMAAAKPDLVVTALTAGSGAVVRRASLAVRDTTRNSGSRRAGASTTGYYLSRDKTRSTGDKSLGSRHVDALAPGKSSSGRYVARIPAATATGRWYLLACADGAHKVAESNETNNCRAAALTVKASTASSGYFPLKPDPLTVTPTFGTGSITSGYAAAYADDADDNTFTMTGSDGTTYTLEVPGGSVPQGVSLTLTPVTGLTGAPTSFAAGVRIEPTGLRLLKAATLTITPAAALPTTDRTAFRFFDGGADAGMYPIDQAHSTASAVVLPITDLATYVVGTSTADQRATALAHPPTRTDGQFDNVIATLPATPAARVAARSTTTWLENLPATARDYYDHVLKPNLVKAETNDALGQPAVTAALAWGHMMQVLGIDDNGRIADSWVLIFKVLDNAVKQEYSRCKVDHQLLDLGRLLGNARTYAVLGASADSANTLAKAQACGHFKLDFDDVVTSDQSYPPGQSGAVFHERIEVHTVDPIAMSLDQFGTFSGTGTIGYRSATYSLVQTYPGQTCTETETTRIAATHPGDTDGVTAHLYVDLRPDIIVAGSGVPVVKAKDGVVYLSGTAGDSSWPSEDFHQQNSGCTSSTYDWTDQHWELLFHHYPGGGSAAPTVPVPASAQSGATVFDHTYTWDNGGAGDVHESHDTETAEVTVTHVPQ